MSLGGQSDGSGPSGLGPRLGSVPVQDYAYISEAWRVVVLVRPTLTSDVIHEVPGPYMPIQKAESDINQIRTAIGGNIPVSLAWLAIGTGQVIGAYLAS
jgi:hypothetical protein